jgi:hypothetical protein
MSMRAAVSEYKLNARGKTLAHTDNGEYPPPIVGDLIAFVRKLPIFSANKLVGKERGS